MTGSTDSTDNLVNQFISENKIDIKYFYQENQGKMSALNNLVPFASGDLIIEIDSDDYLTGDAFQVINDNYKYIKDDSEIYAMVFLRKTLNAKTINIALDKFKTTMFDLYFKFGLIRRYFYGFQNIN